MYASIDLFIYWLIDLLVVLFIQLSMYDLSMRLFINYFTSSCVRAWGKSVKSANLSMRLFIHYFTSSCVHAWGKSVKSANLIDWIDSSPPTPPTPTHPPCVWVVVGGGELEFNWIMYPTIAMTLGWSKRNRKQINKHKMNLSGS